MCIYENRSIRTNIPNLFRLDLLSGFLYSKELAVNDLFDVLDELKNYVTRYDHQIVCAGMEPKSEMCKIVIHQLALKYFEAALNTSDTGFKSYIWRQIHNDELYGVMLILDPKQGNEQDEMHQVSVKQILNAFITII
ncbi:unnamed protein product [Schistosoma curassoni]|uniref:Fuz_longin_3 domain-containing protein n=1 Tax=Schistosoma curassoni TaxID=6186 RepID=A0A183KL65_9TREM|nr:unnamed protein product [Schistosoma curassoni]